MMDSSIDDDDGAAVDEVFEEANTINPGPSLLIATVVLSIVSYALAFLVSTVRTSSSTKKPAPATPPNAVEKEERDESSTTGLSCRQSPQEEESSSSDEDDSGVLPPNKENTIEEEQSHKNPPSSFNHEEEEEETNHRDDVVKGATTADAARSDLAGSGGGDDASATSSSSSSSSCDNIVRLVCKADDETKKICKLAFPFVVAAIIKGAADVARVAIIGRYIGTRELSAYVVVDAFLGITTDFLRGFHESIVTLCSHSIGTENTKLTGQYVQISILLYVLASIPLGIFWLVFMPMVVDWLGFDETTVALAKSFTIWLVITRLLEGIAEGVGTLLEILDHEIFSSFFRIVLEVLCTIVLFIWASIHSPTTTSLDTVGHILVVCYFADVIILCVIVHLTGWFQEYYEGIFRSFAFLNQEAVKGVLKTSLSLAFGYLLNYCEWEILTVFASFLGPAEVAAWSLLGVVWENLEQITERIADASEMRCAYLLGAGRPQEAKISSYKSVLMGFVFATVVTIALFLAGGSWPKWLTADPTLQRLVGELIPIFGVGNLSLTTGTMAWTLVGSQGRYHLATVVGFAGSLFVTIPLAAVLSIAFQINLEGQTAAVVIGYLVSGAVNTYLLLSSEWGKLSLEIIRYNAEHGIVNDDESGCSSSSSSSSSDDEGDNNMWEIIEEISV